MSLDIDVPLIEASLNILDCRDVMKRTIVFRAPESNCLRGEHLGPAVFAISILAICILILPLSIAISLGIIWKNGQSTVTERDQGNCEPAIEWGVMYVAATHILLDTYNYLIFISLFVLICLIRLYIQPYRDMISAYIEREMVVCWIVIMTYRLASFRTPTDNVIPYVNVFLFFPIASHAVNLFKPRYQYLTNFGIRISDSIAQ
ncbi:hypothetical protein HDU67_000194 [Dinochytrium kinnereticum]|nr:hypothetical protein HDU67_000194 [Dinochytrium kinnereticum]